MKKGPYSLFDDDNFGFIFQTCVHFIGCVNLFEENDKSTEKPLTSELLLKLRQTCQNCLQFFDTMHAGWHKATDQDLNLWIIDIHHIIVAFNNLMAANIRELDEEAKTICLPDMVRRLDYFIQLLIAHREKLDQKTSHSRNANPKESAASTSTQADVDLQMANNPQILSVFIQFNNWLKKVQSSTSLFKPYKDNHEPMDEPKLRKSRHDK